MTLLDNNIKARTRHIVMMFSRLVILDQNIWYSALDVCLYTVSAVVNNNQLIRQK